MGCQICSKFRCKIVLPGGNGSTPNPSPKHIPGGGGIGVGDKAPVEIKFICHRQP